MAVIDDLEVFEENIINISMQYSPNNRDSIALLQYIHNAVARLDWDQIAITICANSDVP